MADLSERFDKDMPIDEFNRGYSWTKKGSSEGLKERLYKLVDQLTQERNPNTGVIVFEKLPDCSYEISYYQKLK